MGALWQLALLAVLVSCGTSCSRSGGTSSAGAGPFAVVAIDLVSSGLQELDRPIVIVF